MARSSSCSRSSAAAWYARVSSHVTSGIRAWLFSSTPTRLCQKVSVATAAMADASGPASASSSSMACATTPTSISASTATSPSSSVSNAYDDCETMPGMAAPAASKSMARTEEVPISSARINGARTVLEFAASAMIVPSIFFFHDNSSYLREKQSEQFQASGKGATLLLLPTRAGWFALDQQEGREGGGKGETAANQHRHAEAADKRGGDGLFEAVAQSGGDAGWNLHASEPVALGQNSLPH